MLYDPKWEVQTKPDVLSLESLIAWLEKQPERTTYCFADNGGCLLHQYFTAFGLMSVGVGGFTFRHSESIGRIDLPKAFRIVANGYGKPRTFGAALQRARAELAR